MIRRFRMGWFSIAVMAASVLSLGSFATAVSAKDADTLRATPSGSLPADVRVQPPKDLDGYFPWTPPTDDATWNKRAEELRRQVLVSQGLWPLPEKTPLNAVVHGAIDQGDYTVEKVYFESVPGFYVTGNLYRPKGRTGKLPGMLFAHGHWVEARFADLGRQGVRKEIVIGAERFENGGRSIMQSLCVQLARMGVVVFHYDMIGYCDSRQLSMALAHGFKEQRPEMNSKTNWGLFSPQAESHLQSVMGLQTWNSIRSLDFLLSQPDIDTTRIGITGASGGGTQSFMLAAIDPRITLCVPAVMVSTSMQGGCTCENSSLLRVDTGNIELASLFAPKPMACTTANDWTKEMRTKGFPDMKANWKRIGAENNVVLIDLTHFVHNYNYVSRSAMYSFVNKHFKLGLEEPVVEEDYNRLEIPQLTVYDVAHPKPASGDAFEKQLTATLHAASEKQLAALAPKDAASLAKWKEVVGGGYRAIVGRDLPNSKDIEYDLKEEKEFDGYSRYVALLRNKPKGEEIPVLFYYPKNSWNGKVVIWLSPNGKAGLVNEAGEPNDAVRQLIKQGSAVCGVDLLFQGEFLADGKPITKTRKVANPREAAAYIWLQPYAARATRPRLLDDNCLLRGA
ncbi:MAG: acetylxylan esterase [Pirellulales bacterium]